MVGAINLLPAIGVVVYLKSVIEGDRRPSRVYVVPAGQPLPESATTTTTTEPLPGGRVGHGVEAVNEQVTLRAAKWELTVSGGASAAEVRWPC